GKVRVNNTHPLGLAGTVAGTFTVSWEERDVRETVVRSQNDPSATPPDSVLYNLRYYNADTNALIQQAVNFNATNASVRLNFTGNVRQELEAIDGANGPWMIQSHTFVYDGTGDVDSVITPSIAEYVLDGGAP
ncbi:MAG TPA: hypothetical protein VGB05_00065, partial [Pyrinomonadaceae bacterium]